MGVGRLTRISQATDSVTKEKVNEVIDALQGHIIPRNLEGEPTSREFDLGTPEFRFRNLYVSGEIFAPPTRDIPRNVVTNGGLLNNNPARPTFLQPLGAAGVRIVAEAATPIEIQFQNSTLTVPENIDIPLIATEEARISLSYDATPIVNNLGLPQGEGNFFFTSRNPHVYFHSDQITVDGTTYSVGDVWENGIPDHIPVGDIHGGSVTRAQFLAFATGSQQRAALYNQVRFWRLNRDNLVVTGSLYIVKRFLGSPRYPVFIGFSGEMSSQIHMGTTSGSSVVYTSPTLSGFYTARDAADYPIRSADTNWIFIRANGTAFPYAATPRDLVNSLDRPSVDVNENELGFQRSDGQWFMYTANGGWRSQDIALLGWALREDDGSCILARGVSPVRPATEAQSVSRITANDFINQQLPTA